MQHRRLIVRDIYTRRRRYQPMRRTEGEKNRTDDYKKKREVKYLLLYIVIPYKISQGSSLLV